MRKHFVKFLSPGTLFAEETIKPIDSWDVEKALVMSTDIIERYKQGPMDFVLLQENGRMTIWIVELQIRVARIIWAALFLP